MKKQRADKTGAETSGARYKLCMYCKESKPLHEFLRRTGRKAGAGSRRGACSACRKQRRKLDATINTPPSLLEQGRTNRQRNKTRQLPAPPPRPSGPDAAVLIPNQQNIVWMRGRTDKGRRWQQESDLDTAVTLVKEHAAVVVNRHTVRRLYSNRQFRRYILERDRHTCFFCGQYGDTIDHLLPRAKGGHTTPMNCVCACNLCNQSKADRDFDEFMQGED